MSIESKSDAITLLKSNRAATIGVKAIHDTMRWDSLVAPTNAAEIVGGLQGGR